MGYANSLPYQQITIYTGVAHGNFLLENSNTHSYNIAEFIIPNYTAPLSKAYLAIIVQYLKDWSHSDNYLISGSYGIKDTGATYRQAETYSSYAYYVIADATQCTPIWETSTQDIHQYITAGATQSLRVESLQCLADTMTMNNIYGKLDLYFAID